MKKALLVALMGLMTIITANAAVDFQNITITLKDGQVIKYDASQLDHVTYVGGEFGEEGAVGIKLYTTATSSEDYLYSQIISIVYDTQESTTTTFTRITSTDQLEAGKRYIIVCEEQSGAMGGIYNNNYRSIVTSGITLNNGTATVENESNVSIFTLGGSTSSWTFNDGSYLANPSSGYLSSSETDENTAKWSIAFSGNNATITNKQNSTRVISFNSNYNDFYASNNGGTAVQLYVEDNGGSVTPTTVATPTFSPAGGTYSVAQTVTITTTTSGATIYYTTDGTIPTTNSTHYTAAITVSTTTTIKAIAVKDGVSSAVATATFTINSGSTTDNNVNRNALSSKYDKDKYMWSLEWPRINETDNNTWVVKSTSEYGVTFSLEWSNSLIANRWTCYTMHSGNNAKTVSRKDAFAEDPDLPSSTRSKLDDYSNSGYSRGHLCPSADRLCSREQNSQTFYLSNMQPQWQSHNGGIWLRLENKIRDWDEICDTLYVVKAATISDVTLNNSTSAGIYTQKCNNRLPVPKYFYMAVLARTGNTYKAVGFWTEHTDDAQTSTSLASCAITIDELERRTGIDFFCNLPDDIENVVEATYDSSFWNP